MASKKDIFDIVISFDTTGSMTSCLQNVKDKMQSMIRKLKKDIPGIRIGVIAHGDYDSNRYIIKYEDLTDNVRRLCNFTQAAEGSGSGKTSQFTSDEAYELALRYSRTKFSWRHGSNRALVIIGDCRPHEKDFSMNTDHIDWTEEMKHLREMDVKIYAVQCRERKNADSFYHRIASFTFGHHQNLKDFSKVEQVLMSICYRETGLLQTSTQTAIKRQQNPQNIVEETDSDKEEIEQDAYGLMCKRCSKRKPHNEFPTVSVSEKCEHFPGVCLRCVVEHVEAEGTCPLYYYPHTNNDTKVSPSSVQLKIFQATLKEMFIDYTEVYEETRKKMLSSKGNKIRISSMGGDTALLDYDPKLTIAALKKEVQRQTGVSKADQKILFKEQKLMSSSRTLSDYGIGPNESLSMIIPLYSIPENLDHVVFDLSWEFSDQSKDFDFLDASCFAFQKTDFLQVIDWNHPENQYFLKGSIKHTEKNETTADGRIGHQTIEVYLQRVPSDITHLFFTLSSWKAPNLAAFTNPTLNFYQASDSDNNLCETTLSHALDSQAVIMCYVVRTNKKWQIFDCDMNSCVSGNSKKYNPIRQRISDLIMKN